MLLPPFRQILILFANGLYGNCICHHGIEIVSCHAAKYAVQRFLQNGVALHNGDADVHIFLRDFKIVIAAGEVQDRQVGISDQSALGISVQTKSTIPVSSAISMAGAVSCALWMSAPAIWGRQESYQMVPR